VRLAEKKLGENMTIRRRAIVVGGAGGIGGDICHRLASEGYRLVVADFNMEGAKLICDSLAGEGHEAAQLDVTDEHSVATAFEAIETSAPPAILVIASGGPVVHLGAGTNVASMSMADWKKTIDLNFTGVFCCVRKFAQLRIARAVDQSRIVIIGSAAGLLAGNGTDIAYGASKAGLFGLARQAAVELAGAGVTVNVVAPGPVGTAELFRNTNEQIRAGIASLSVFKRLATPEEVSAGVSFLLSPEASFITGTTLDINGGVYMR
jgi:NAD(P)-dependent dehydrogenase (short-subunit alcohol dehydrogenase family)